jgi:transcriptional regulator with XRE-family HTH domain
MTPFFSQLLENRRDSETISEFATRCGVTHTTLYAWKRGQTPKVPRVFEVAEKLAIDPLPLILALVTKEA